MQVTGEQKRLTPALWLLLILVSFLWGGSFAANRLVLDEMGFISAVAFRVTGAAAALWIWIALRRMPVQLTPRLLFDVVILGVGGNVITFLFVSWGQQHIASSLAGILNASAAVFTVLLGALVYTDERLTGSRALGVALSVVGVTVTIGSAALRTLDVLALGQLAVLAGNLTYALCTIHARRALAGVSPVVSTALTFTVGAPVLVPLALLQEGAPTLDYRAETWVAIAFLSLFTSALAYILFYWLLGLVGAGNVSLATLLNGPWAILIGAILLDEILGPSAITGFCLIALGLIIMDGRLLQRLRR